MSPTIANQTLVVHVAPDGKGKTQLQHSIQKNQGIHWEILQCHNDPSGMLGCITVCDWTGGNVSLVMVSYSPSEFQPIESGILQLQRAALGLNRNFPLAVLHGHPFLGGLGTPSLFQKNAKDRLNYFFYNIRHESSISQKLALSIIYTQTKVDISNNSLPALSTYLVWAPYHSDLLYSAMERAGTKWTYLMPSKVRDLGYVPPRHPSNIPLMNIAAAK